MVMGSLSNHFHGLRGREGRAGELLSVGVSDSNQASIGPGNQLQIQQLSNSFHRAAFYTRKPFTASQRESHAQIRGYATFLPRHSPTKHINHQNFQVLLRIFNQRKGPSSCFSLLSKMKYIFNLLQSFDSCV